MAKSVIYDGLFSYILRKWNQIKSNQINLNQFILFIRQNSIKFHLHLNEIIKTDLIRRFWNSFIFIEQTYLRILIQDISYQMSSNSVVNKYKGNCNDCIDPTDCCHRNIGGYTFSFHVSCKTKVSNILLQKTQCVSKWFSEKT